jgi:hypothetical protein
MSNLKSVVSIIEEIESRGVEYYNVEATVFSTKVSFEYGGYRFKITPLDSGGYLLGVYVIFRDSDWTIWLGDFRSLETLLSKMDSFVKEAETNTQCRTVRESVQQLARQEYRVEEDIGSLSKVAKSFFEDEESLSLETVDNWRANTLRKALDLLVVEDVAYHFSPDNHKTDFQKITQLFSQVLPDCAISLENNHPPFYQLGSCEYDNCIYGLCLEYPGSVSDMVASEAIPCLSDRNAKKITSGFDNVIDWLLDKRKHYLCSCDFER